MDSEHESLELAGALRLILATKFQFMAPKPMIVGLSIFRLTIWKDTKFEAGT